VALLKIYTKMGGMDIVATVTIVCRFKTCLTKLLDNQ